jgi:hypothetical protein
METIRAPTMKWFIVGAYSNNVATPWAFDPFAPQIAIFCGGNKNCAFSAFL